MLSSFQAKVACKSSAVIFRSVEISSFSRRLNDSSVDLPSSLAGVVLCETIHRCVDLSVEFAHVALVKSVDIGSFFAESVFFETLFASKRPVHLDE